MDECLTLGGARPALKTANEPDASFEAIIAAHLEDEMQKEAAR